jgi:hypothetical protein
MHACVPFFQQRSTAARRWSAPISARTCIIPNKTEYGVKQYQHPKKSGCDYKSRLYGSRIVVAGRFYPSSKTCSSCGVIKETLALSQRTFTCDDCGFEADRDVNAALNLARIAASSAVTACGELRSGTGRKARVKRGSMKQEEKSTSEAA